MSRAPRPLTQNPFEGLRTTSTGLTTVAAPDPSVLAAQREAIARMHRAARKRQRQEAAVFGIRYDVEGRAHDVHTGRYTSKPKG